MLRRHIFPRNARAYSSKLKRTTYIENTFLRSNGILKRLITRVSGINLHVRVITSRGSRPPLAALLLLFARPVRSLVAEGLNSGCLLIHKVSLIPCCHSVVHLYPSNQPVVLDCGDTNTHVHTYVLIVVSIDFCGFSVINSVLIEETLSLCSRCRRDTHRARFKIKSTRILQPSSTRIDYRYAMGIYISDITNNRTDVRFIEGLFRNVLNRS